jgi:hypothetical protein
MYAWPVIFKKGASMNSDRIPYLMIRQTPEGSLVIRNHIPYMVTPHPKDAGHIVSIVVNDSHICPLVIVETFALGIKYLQNFNKEHILEEVA